MKKLLRFEQNQLPAVMFALSILLAGLFYEYAACFFGAALLVCLIIRGCREKSLTLYRSFPMVTVFVIALSYGASILWAIDSGMAVTTFLKMLTVPLFLLLLMQYPEAKEKLLKGLPAVVAVLTVLSLLGSLVPLLSRYLTVADRYAGTFQYPNTYALLLLVAELLLLSQKKLSVKNCCIFAVLIFGILYSGSRTVFVIAILANLAMGIFSGNKKARILTVAAVVGGTALVLLAAWISGSDVLYRFLRFSVFESTFAGRFLYFFDALPVILKHPFGLGGWGYYSIQQSVQTGVYSTVYVHNDILQLMLDVGWIPAVLLVIAVGKTVFDKKAQLSNKVILVAVFLHCCFDFDLQFVSMFILLFLFLDLKDGKEITVRWKKGHTVAAAAAVCVLAYMGVALWLPKFGYAQAGHTLYPWNTDNNTTLLIAETDPEKRNALADEILKQNEYVGVAYSAKAQNAYTLGNFTALIQYKHQIFEKFPFQYAEYEEYCQMLLSGMELYEQIGDTASINFCKQELIKTKAALEGLNDRLSYFGRIIVDQPTTSLPAHIASYIDSLAQEAP